MKKTILFLMGLFACMQLQAQSVREQVLGSMEWAQIGNPGNTADDNNRGSVGYFYSIGKQEISIAQFMNAYDAGALISDGDENYWNNGSHSLGTNAPATFINWHEAACFCNWLTSGNSSNGVYQMGESNLVVGMNRTAALEQYETVYAMPTLDEWYKAAYFNGSGYSDYANGTNTPPAAMTDANYTPLATPWAVGSGTVEQNGTFDIMGNVNEWTETLYDGANSALEGWIKAHGGYYSGTTNLMGKSVATIVDPTTSAPSYGFRVAVISSFSSGTITHDGAVINMDFITINDVGNPADTGGRGSVDYVYQIGKYEVTIEQFMTAYAADNNISNGGEDYWNKGSYSLGTNTPASTITWYEAAQFCNWLTSGSSSSGAYQLDASGVVTNVDRAAALIYGSVYVIPTEDEWYKAAYWTGSGYSTYANGTDTPPVVQVDANYSPTDGPWNIATGSQEQNGTFNMMGNVAEWSESVTASQNPYIFGGWYSQNDHYFSRRGILGSTSAIGESSSRGLRIIELKRDSDGDGLPDSWELQYFGSVDKADPDAFCSNGVDKVKNAYIAGINPNDPQCRFSIQEIHSLGEDQILQWNTISGRVYSVYWTTNLLSGFQCLDSNIPWTRADFTNSTAVPCGYYKIGVQLAD